MRFESVNQQIDMRANLIFKRVAKRCVDRIRVPREFGEVYRRAYWEARFYCCALLFRFVCTIDTKRRGRIEIQALYIDGLLTGFAITEIVTFDAAKRRRDLS